MVTGDGRSELMRRLECLAEKDSELKETLNLLPNALKGSVAVNTTKAYSKQWDKWLLWCDKFLLQMYPPTEESVILFLLSKLQLAKSPIVMQQTIYGLKWGYESKGFHCFITPVMQKILEFSKRNLGKPIKKNKPLKAKHIRRLVKKCGGKHAALPDI